MSKEHYVTPDEIKKLIEIHGFYYIGYSIEYNDLNSAQNVIDAMRPINSKDPEFKYSCECNRSNTIWWFVYKNKDVYIEAENKCNEVILQNRKARGDQDTYIGGEYSGRGYTACVCPLDM